MATLPAKITDYPHKGQLDLTNDYIVTNNGTSTYNTQLQKIIEAATKEAMKNVDNVFIMYHRNQDNYPFTVRPHEWTSLQNAGEVADGVLIEEGGKILVVAPTESTLLWSSENVIGGGYVPSSLQDALTDWNGRANTTAQLTKAACQGVNYAAGYCNAYSRANANGRGLTAGKWWLSSNGELEMMGANIIKINYALGFINGATLLSYGGLYWSSTECDSTTAWGQFLGHTTSNSYKSTSGKVRPVSTFLL